jgi:hypothetical protein
VELGGVDDWMLEWQGGLRWPREGGGFQGVQGATVLHCLSRLYKTVIQGATQGATDPAHRTEFRMGNRRVPANPESEVSALPPSDGERGYGEGQELVRSDSVKPFGIRGAVGEGLDRTIPRNGRRGRWPRAQRPA